tara:strand:- start:5766 stop:5927 length:162 start_codon:yes stop_codon:yes gene_type:complete
MASFNEIITFEHVLEHDLAKHKNFSPPKIYTGKGDMVKFWWVYFSSEFLKLAN